VKRIIPTTNVFKEGVYNLTDFKGLLQDKIYGVQNVSLDKIAYIIILDNNFVILQSIELIPQSIKYILAPLKSNYKVVIIGDGDVYIA
jgi:hypothetical protein